MPRVIDPLQSGRVISWANGLFQRVEPAQEPLPSDLPSSCEPLRGLEVTQLQGTAEWDAAGGTPSQWLDTVKGDL